MLPAISEFFKDTIGENLKKVLQPSSLFTTAIFLLLNLLLVFPTLVEEGSPIATAYLGLDTAWQLALAGP